MGLTSGLNHTAVQHQQQQQQKKRTSTFWYILCCRISVTAGPGLLLRVVLSSRALSKHFSRSGSGCTRDDTLHVVARQKDGGVVMGFAEHLDDQPAPTQAGETNNVLE